MRTGKFSHRVRQLLNAYDGQVKVQDENTGVQQYDVAYITTSDPEGLRDLIIHIRPNQPQKNEQKEATPGTETKGS